MTHRARQIALTALMMSGVFGALGTPSLAGIKHIGRSPGGRHHGGEGNKVRCTIKGTAGEDYLGGTAGRDVICGRAGKDRIAGRTGEDTIYAGAGGDIVLGGGGADSIHAD